MPVRNHIEKARRSSFSEMSIMLPSLSVRREHLSNILQHVKLKFDWRRAYHLAEVPSFVGYGMQF